MTQKPKPRRRNCELTLTGHKALKAICAHTGQKQPKAAEDAFVSYQGTLKARAAQEREGA